VGPSLLGHPRPEHGGGSRRAHGTLPQLTDLGQPFIKVVLGRSLGHLGRGARNIGSDRLQSSDRHHRHVCHVRGQSSEVTRITGEEAYPAAERSRGHGNDCVDGVVPAGSAE